MDGMTINHIVSIDHGSYQMSSQPKVTKTNQPLTTLNWLNLFQGFTTVNLTASLPMVSTSDLLNQTNQFPQPPTTKGIKENSL